MSAATGSNGGSSDAPGPRSLVTGIDCPVPVYGGGSVPYANLDNAATTPPLKSVLDAVDRFSECYSSIHRGTGYKSLVSTSVYERCRDVVLDFVGADPDVYTVIFTCNATYGLNKLARRLRLERDDVVLTTLMEHHSNMLPWRAQPCRTVYADVNRENGSLDVDDLERKARQHAENLKVVTVTGASNVTGSMPPLGRIARIAHECGAWFVCDATQLVPHRPVDMGAPDDPERVDFMVFSAHKMYAPFGCGALIGPKEVFRRGDPDNVGGGTIMAVTEDDVAWANPPEKEEAGTPNVMGAVALATALRGLQKMDREDLSARERELTGYTLQRLAGLPGVRLFGRTHDDSDRDRVGTISFQVDTVEHGLLAAVLGYEWGIGVRNGCFCAQPYVRELLGISRKEMESILCRLAAGDHTTVPGLVRVSLGIYNTREEVDRLIEAIRAVRSHGPRARYVLHPEHKDYVPDDWQDDYAKHVPF